jgi:predicted thioesterase
MDVRIRAEIVRIEGRKVSFKVEAFDEVEKTSEGYHDMFVIDKERFDRGVAKKWEGSQISAGS